MYSDVIALLFALLYQAETMVKDCIGHRLNVSFKPFESKLKKKKTRLKSISLMRFFPR